MVYFQKKTKKNNTHILTCILADDIVINLCSLMAILVRAKQFINKTDLLIVGNSKEKKLKNHSI